MRQFTIILFGILFSFLSCNKISTIQDELRHETESIYFVKYCSQGASGRYDATYKNENEEYIKLINISGNEFERTIGPVSKGFVCSFSIRMDYGQPTVRIEIKKDSDPFVVKKEGINSVSYTIE